MQDRDVMAANGKCGIFRFFNDRALDTKAMLPRKELYNMSLWLCNMSLNDSTILAAGAGAALKL